MSQPTANSHSMTRHSITRMVSHPGLPVAMVATLAGMSLVMLCEAFTECAYLTMDASPLTFRLAVAAAMLATAMGPTVLARVVRLLRNITFKNFDAHRVSESGPARASQQQAEDHELRWMITSSASAARSSAKPLATAPSDFSRIVVRPPSLLPGLGLLFISPPLRAV